MVHLRHFDNLGTARFVTFSCYHRYNLLMSETTIRPFLEELESSRRTHGYALLGYVIMPNHVHLVLYPSEPMALGLELGRIKAHSAFKIISSWKAQNNPVLDHLKAKGSRKSQYAFWQPRGYDHNCRTVETVREKVNYCHMNPVKTGLVSDPVEWPWSSYRWYIGDKQGIVQIDKIEL